MSNMKIILNGMKNHYYGVPHKVKHDDILCIIINHDLLDICGLK